ncbi:MAG: GntP family permease [Prevotellaceae bacterium]|jgi:GntP family gluconate:H+ symporter|nr:GntP family permease [Prevotellaceae bacterium]
MTALGALIGLFLSILLIIKKIHPVYSLMIGAVLGGLLGGVSLTGTMTSMVDGVKDVSPAVIRILSAGVLSGVLIGTGAAATISNAIIRKLGVRHVFFALAFATFLLCAVGVFIDVAVITVAPIALVLGKRLEIPVPVLLIAMVGGGKSGNIISPNPNTIIAAENFGADLSSVMFYGAVPALIGLITTVLLTKLLARKHTVRSTAPLFLQEQPEGQEQLPPLWISLLTPLVAIVLLALRPLFGLVVDPLVALPAGGLFGILCMGYGRKTGELLRLGLQKMTPVAILLIGTGAIAGVIKHSTLKDEILSLLGHLNLSDIIIAPVSGALMSAATASTTAGAMLASASFADIVLGIGVPAAWGALMVNAGATVLDHLPHGSFFHTTGGVCELSFKERLKLVPYETLIGTVLATASTLLYLLF